MHCLERGVCAYCVQMKNEAVKSSLKGICVHRQNEIRFQTEVSPVSIISLLLIIRSVHFPIQ